MAKDSASFQANLRAFKLDKKWPNMKVEELQELVNDLPDTSEAHLLGEAEDALTRKKKFRDDWKPIQNDPKGQTLSELEWWKEAVHNWNDNDTKLKNAIEEGIAYHNSK